MVQAKGGKIADKKKSALNAVGHQRHKHPWTQAVAKSRHRRFSAIAFGTRIPPFVLVVAGREGGKALLSIHLFANSEREEEEREGGEEISTPIPPPCLRQASADFSTFVGRKVVSPVMIGESRLCHPAGDPRCQSKSPLPPPPPLYVQMDSITWEAAFGEEVFDTTLPARSPSRSTVLMFFSSFPFFAICVTEGRGTGGGEKRARGPAHICVSLG